MPSLLVMCVRVCVLEAAGCKNGISHTSAIEEQPDQKL